MYMNSAVLYVNKNFKNLNKILISERSVYINSADLYLNKNMLNLGVLVCAFFILGEKKTRAGQLQLTGNKL